MSFQTSVNYQPAPAVEGAFASANPRASVIAGPNQLVADTTNGATIGRFGWMDSTSTEVSNAGSGAPDGFVANELQASITTWLANHGMLIQAGEPITLFNQGDFWVKTLTTATVGQKVFASTTTGEVKTGAAGATVTGYVETKWSVASAGAVDELIKITSWV